MALQEFAENTVGLRVKVDCDRLPANTSCSQVDIQHFQPLHGKMTIPFTSVTIPGITIQHAATWEPSTRYISKFKDVGYLIIAGRHLKKTAMEAEVTFIGPGGVVIFSELEAARRWHDCTY